MKLKTQKQIQKELLKTNEHFSKETFKKLMIKIADITSKELIESGDDEYGSLDFLYNISRVFLYKHFGEIYKDDKYLLEELDNSPDVIFGIKGDKIENIFDTYKQYVNNETLEAYYLETYEINVISDVVGDTYVSCYSEFYKGSKEEASNRAEELRKQYGCEIVRVTRKDKKE